MKYPCQFLFRHYFCAFVSMWIVLWHFYGGNYPLQNGSGMLVPFGETRFLASLTKISKVPLELEFLRPNFLPEFPIAFGGTNFKATIISPRYEVPFMANSSDKGSVCQNKMSNMYIFFKKGVVKNIIPDLGDCTNGVEDHQEVWY